MQSEIAIDTARMLPSLTGEIPVEAKLRENTGNLGRLLFRKLNPNPVANNFSQLEKPRRFASQERQQLPRFKRAVCIPPCKINSAVSYGVRLFGSALES